MGRFRALAVLGLGLVLAYLALSTVVSYERGDAGEQAWESLRGEFASKDVKSVELRAAGRTKTIPSGPQAQAYADALFSGAFDWTNSRSEGPTAEVVVLLDYDGRDLPLIPNQWPDGRFELTWTGVQFLVRSPQLARLLSEEGFVNRQ